jgi:hypothetical protein
MSIGALKTGYAIPARVANRPSLAIVLLWIQAPYYLLTGVWPFVSIRSFQYVTGQKYDHLPNGGESDHWLVLAVGALVTAIGLTLLVAAWRRRISLEIAVLAICSSLGLTLIDVIYVLRRVIAPIYLLDAAIEIPLIATWLIVLVQQLQMEGTAR